MNEVYIVTVGGCTYDPSKWFKFEAVVDKIQATRLRQVLDRREITRALVSKSYQRQGDQSSVSLIAIDFPRLLGMFFSWRF